MSYVFFPARETNFYPPGPPYLAGLRGYGMRGLGDYAADLAAYNADLANWRTESIAATRNQKVYDTKVKDIDAAYAAAVTAYNADLATWNKEYGAYISAAMLWESAFAKYKAENTEKSKTIAAYYKLNLSAEYYNAGACVTQAQHDSYKNNCRTVKGIGSYGMRGLGSSDPNCGSALLPVCQFGPYPKLRAKPVAPTKPAYPAKPTALRAMPVKPTEPAKPATPVTPIVKTTPVVPATVPQSTTPVVAAEEPKQANVLMGGLIVAAVAVGGFLVYRTLKKPKAKAA